MVALTALSLLPLLPLLSGVAAHPVQPVQAPASAGLEKRTVDTTYPYTGPANGAIGDPMDQTLQGNGKGYPRLWEKPAVRPAPGAVVTNNINVISTAFFPGGINVHFQTPFGIGADPVVKYGTKEDGLNQKATGYSHTYDRTPPCSLMDPTQCSQHFHEVRLDHLKAGTTYYYQIDGGNGTTPSDVLSFTTAPAPGDKTPFSFALLADMGYTNARGTHLEVINAVTDGAAFVLHSGDISYADQWYSGMIPCDSGSQCYNGSSSTLPGGKIDIPDWLMPLPAGEHPSQGGPYGGDISTVYETNYDLWQQWMNDITKHVPYMVAVGNHEAACVEGDASKGQVSAMLDDNQPIGSTKNKTSISYYSCPETQRNFTGYQHRFTMPGEAVGGRSNFWYSFDYGMAHILVFDGETDFYQSPEAPFVADLAKYNHTGAPLRNETWPTDAGPFGAIKGSFKDNKAYEQIQWIQADLAKVDRKKTPWVFATSHRPMYSTQVQSYQQAVRNAFEDVLLAAGVDAYFSGHIHWYERMLPMAHNGTIAHDAVINNHTYKADGKSITHIVHGNAGNVENHSQLGSAPLLELTAKVDTTSYGFAKLTVHNESAATYEFIRGQDGSIGDYVTLVKGN